MSLSARMSSESPSLPTATETRLRGRALLLARSAWLAFAALTLVVFIASLPALFTGLQTICQAATCPPWQITPQAARAMQQVGLQLGSNAAGEVVLAALLELVCFAVGAVVFWRRADERVALVVSLFLVIFVCNFNNNLDALDALHPAWTLPVRLVNCVSGLSWFALLVFPDGRFVPRWIRWPALGLALVSLPVNLFPGSPLDLKTQLGDPYQAFLAVQGFVMVGIQIYRYVRVSTPIQRQQTKVVVFAVATAILLSGAMAIADPALSNGAPQSVVDFLLGGVAFLLISLVPVSIGIAVLRYRLWDVDALINKALVYSLLTAILGALYVGLIIGLESLAEAITGTNGQNPILLVISTLAIAALVQPVRRRLQAFIDRRFYRKKYDAAKTLAAFSATLRDEVDLNDLREHLLAVVQETMQPANTSLWLRQPERRLSDMAHRLEPSGQAPIGLSSD